jgi:hypothetical protein
MGRVCHADRRPPPEGPVRASLAHRSWARRQASCVVAARRSTAASRAGAGAARNSSRIRAARRGSPASGRRGVRARTRARPRAWRRPRPASHAPPRCRRSRRRTGVRARRGAAPRTRRGVRAGGARRRPGRAARARAGAARAAPAARGGAGSRARRRPSARAAETLRPRRSAGARSRGRTCRRAKRRSTSASSRSASSEWPPSSKNSSSGPTSAQSSTSHHGAASRVSISSAARGAARVEHQRARVRHPATDRDRRRHVLARAALEGRSDGLLGRAAGVGRFGTRDRGPAAHVVRGPRLVDAQRGVQRHAGRGGRDREGAGRRLGSVRHRGRDARAPPEPRGALRSTVANSPAQSRGRRPGAIRSAATELALRRHHSPTGVTAYRTIRRMGAIR